MGLEIGFGEVVVEFLIEYVCCLVVVNLVVEKWRIFGEGDRCRVVGG